MKIKLSEFKKLITKMVLQEVDLTKVDRGWLGAYAFVLAYNTGLAEGLFPRNQKMNLEFIVDGKSAFMNGTLFINANEEPEVYFFQGGPGHDMLHAITQNSQMHFASFAGGARSPKLSQDISKNNTNKFGLRNLRRLSDEILEKFGIDISKEFNLNTPKTSIEILIDNIKKFLRNQDKTNGAVNYFVVNMQQANYYDNRHINKSKPNAPTHAIEEELGNLVSDSFKNVLPFSKFMSDRKLSEILEAIDSWDEDKAYEFPFYDHETNSDTIFKWKEYIKRVLPRFVELYNEKLALLSRTKFGHG